MASTTLAQAPGNSMGSLTQGESPLTPDDRAAMGQIFWHRLQGRLGLSDQQATEIHALLDDYRAVVQVDVEGLEAARDHLRDVLEQPTVEGAELLVAANQVKVQQAALFDARLGAQLAVRVKLTPEQWQQWQALFKAQAQRWYWPGPPIEVGAP